jgi:PAS domain S-box-containing protein
MTGSSSAASAPLQQLDIATVAQVLQAVSTEIELGRLIATIMRLALEHAGAERALLIVLHGDACRIEAEARTGVDAVAVDSRSTEITGEALPLSVLRHVLHARESVLLQDASTDPAFSGDDYVRVCTARSVLCMPLLNQARLVGVLYLENNRVTGAFTPVRMTLLRLLVAEAAVSLENARLYRDLQERESRMRRLADSNIIGIAIWHADGRILDINDAFLRLIGYERQDFVSGRVRWTDFVPPEWREHDVRALVDTRAEGPVQAHEREYIHESGRRVPVLAGGAIFDATPDEGVAFVVDLTELKRAEEVARESELRFHQTQMQLTDANRVASVAQLAASIAHEINQPLAGITTNAGTCLRMLAGESVDLEGLGTVLRRTLRDVNRASDIVTRLRALFANKEMATGIIDLNEAIREAITLASAGLQRSQVILRCEFAEDLPSVEGDLVQLQQVISNLVRNASDAMGSVDDRPRQLVVRTVREGADLVRLDVQDSGMGVDPALLDKLFEPFYTTKAEGMGVGLSVSRSIIERHNGRLWATPNEGPGATFSFSLPRAGVDAPTPMS